MSFLETKESGNAAFKNGDYATAVECYSSALEGAKQVQPQSFETAHVQLACHSNLAAAYLKLSKLKASELATAEGLSIVSICQGFVDIEEQRILVEKLEHKLKAREKIFIIRELVVKNSRSSKRVTATSPTDLSNSLLRDMFIGGARVTAYFYEGQMTSVTAGGVQFLATIHVLTCITIFAHCHDKVTGKIRAFGAHVNMGNILHSVLQSAMKHGRARADDVLPEVVSGLVETFEGCDKSAVKVYLVGGHKRSDNDTAICEYFKNTPELQYFSALVRRCVSLAGLNVAKIDDSLLNVFEGVERITSMETEMRLREENQRFVLAALDLETGLIVTHTEHASAKRLIPADSSIRAAETAWCRQLTMMGASVKKIVV